MGNLFRKFGWLTSLLIFFTPIFLIMFLGALMARGQVKGEFDRYQTIQEYTSLASLPSASEGEIVMVYGHIADGPSPQWAKGLVVFQERPLEGRETRFLEQFPMVFPSFTLAVSDGTLLVEPGSQQVIAHELHRLEDQAQKREYTGFRVGDRVTLQGKWQAPAPGAEPVLQNVTGISSLDRAGIIAEGKYAFRRLDTICFVLGGLTVLSALLLAIQLLRSRGQEQIASPVGVSY